MALAFVSQIGSGSTTLTAVNTYSGGTLLAAGTLIAGNDSALGTGALTVAANPAGTTLDNTSGATNLANSIALNPSSNLIIGGSNPLTLAGLISGGGALTKNGAATLILAADNSYAGGTTINTGTLQVGNGGTTGSVGTGPVLDDSALVFNRSGTVAVPGAITGTGSLTQDGVAGGTLVLTGANTYAGGTTIASGVLQLGGGGTSGSIVGNVADADTGTLAFDRSDTMTFAGVISGGGAVSQIGSGTTVLTGASTYSGGTAISAGTLQLGNGGTSGSITGNVVDNGAFAFDRSDAVTFPGLISGTGSVSQIGSGSTTLTAVNTYSGGTLLAAGTLIAGNDSALGTGALTVAANPAGTTLDNTAAATILANPIVLDPSANLTVAGSNPLTLAGLISGGGALTKNGAATLILAADNSYAGGTTIAAGTLQLGAGGTTGGIIGDVVNNGTLALDRSDTVTFGGMIAGGGGLNQIGSGTTVLDRRANSYAGPTNVNAGALYVNGDQTAATGVTTVASGATLGGVGIVGGNVAIANGGTLAPGGVGPTIGTLTIDGDLGLHSGSILNYDFGQNSMVGGPLNDLTVVKGNLTLAGTLNVMTTPGGEFDPGVYRVISYSGSLTDNGLGLGIVPPGSVEVVQTSVANQVNLVVTNGLTLNYWDGASGPKDNGVVDGGNGVWNSTGAGANDNWTTASGAINAPWTPAAFAIFEATPGTVMVDNSLGQVTASGMQFASDGYLITGGPISLVETTAGSGQTIIRVGDGTVVGAGMTATIASVLQGDTELVKTDLGTLVLSGMNTYTGGTAINGGTVQVAADNNLGAATSGLRFDGGTLATTASFTTNRATTLNANGGTFDIAPTTTLTMAGVIGGAGALTKADIGTLVLTGTNTYSGGTTIASGVLQLGAGGTTGSIVGNVADSGTLAFDFSNGMTFAGVISGGGAVSQIGSGATILTADNPYTGGTTINAGTLAVGDFAHPSAALSGDGPIAVGAGGTLGGYGSVTAAVTNDGVIAPGSATPGFSGSPTGTFTIIGNLLNQGAIQLASGESIGNVLEVRGNYMSAGGSMAINTFLGNDSSPSDKLVINGGAATGSTSVHVTNVGGPGALTTANGILVVDAISGATTSPGAFSLSNPELRAGAFDYRLFQGGVSGSPNDWFLRSTLVSPPIPPIPPVPPPPLSPIIGPELATYGVVQPLARQLGLSILGTLDDRVGDTYQPDGCAVTPAVSPNALPTRKPGPTPAPCPLFSPSIWGRFFGQTLDNHYTAFADPRASGNLGGFQGGIDLLRGSLIAGHYERAGLYGAYGDVNADVNGLVTNPAATADILARTGSMNLDAWSAGGYWTHTGPGGWYLDAVLQGTWYYGSASTQFARLNTDGTGFIGSLEGGYPFSWPQLGPGFVIEPQGQILWQKVSFRHEYDGLGDVALGDTTGPSGRIGLRTKWTIATAGGQVWQPYLRANLWRDLGAEADAVYSGTDISQAAGEVQVTQRLELGGGLTGRINANVSVFANVDYEFAVGASESEKRNGVRGAFGARYTW